MSIATISKEYTFTNGTETADANKVNTNFDDIYAVTNETINVVNATTVQVNTINPSPGNLTGTLTGNVTGNLTGNVTGNVTGNITGNVTGDVTGKLNTLSTGNASGNIPVSNGTVCANLNADKLDGYEATTFRQVADGSVAKAWVNFTAVGGTVTIRKSYNVTSVARNGTGDYTITFTNAMSDANYCVLGNSVSAGGTTPGWSAVVAEATNASNTYSTKTTMALRINTSNATDAGPLEETFSCNVVIFD